MRFVRLTLWMLILLGHGATALAGVTPALQKAIRAATFEVVRKKPDHDPLEYEKPLPFELLPFTQRNDAYESIGTAFALGDNTYVTAAHVLVVGVNSQYGPPSLRASDGTVYSIDRILKFSQFRDFAIFSISKDPQPVGFQINRTPQVDDAVLAVGNALGDGIVIRDGLFTSETAEDQDGRWKWIRFSAAASPGNSGGPLLDATGKVIGIVIGKSPNENLNYSLPIKEALDAPANTATFDQRLVTHFLILRNSSTYSYKQEFKLPLSWTEFAKNYEQVVVHHSEAARAALLSTYDAKIFPKGSGTESLLFDLDPEFTPRIINQQTDNTWEATSPRLSRADLSGDGYVTISQDVGGGLILVKLHRSDDSTDDAFYSNSKAFMDAALKGLNVTRTVGEDNVRVTSLGAALSDTLITDHYGRKWQQRVWPLPYIDAYVIGTLLPTPDGYAALLQYIPSMLLQFGKTQSNQLLDYVDISYSGTLAQWQAHLKRRSLLPAGFADLKLDVSKGVALQTKRFMLDVPASVLTTDQRSELRLDMGFMRDGERVAWDVGGARLYRDAQHRSYVNITRQKQPPESAKLELRNKFSNMQNRRSPYDSEWSRDTDVTYSIASAIDAPGKTPGKISPDLVYGVTLALEGSPDKTELAKLQRLLVSSTKVLERGDAAEADQAKHANSAVTNDAKEKTNEWLENIRKYVDSTEAELKVKDTRGRTIATDAREFIIEPLQKMLADPNALPDEYYELWTSVDERKNVLEAYWRQVGGLNNNREVWMSFLQANRLSPITAHTSQVRELESKLARSLTGVPTAEWAVQAKALSEAYFQERKQVALDQARLSGTPFVHRNSDCPSPADKTSGKEQARIDPASKSFPDDYYPATATRAHEEGYVILEVKVDESGCAIEARVAASSGYQDLDAAALKTYELMRFLPGVRGNKAIASSATVPFKFKLNDCCHCQSHMMQRTVTYQLTANLFSQLIWKSASQTPHPSRCFPANAA